MVNINNVYQTVLILANKDNRGYITPDEFNRMADQAQNEIFEAYFARDASYQAAGGIQSDFSNPVSNVAERINLFYKSVTPTISNNIFPYPDDLRQLGVVSVDERVADKVTHEHVKYINLSPLTYPVKTQPVYTVNATGITVYPTTVTTGVKMEYLKNPTRPKWGYVLQGTIPYYDSTQFDPSTDSYDTPAKSYNFELDSSEFPELVVTILGYAGLTIKQGDVTGFAQGREVQFQQTEQ